MALLALMIIAVLIPQLVNGRVVDVPFPITRKDTPRLYWLVMAAQFAFGAFAAWREWRNPTDPDLVGIILQVLTVVVGGGSAAFISISRNAPRKRRILRWAVLFSGTALLLIAHAIGTPALTMFCMVLFCLASGAMVVGSIYFCDACGETVMNENPGRPTTCPKCMADVDR